MTKCDDTASFFSFFWYYLYKHRGDRHVMSQLDDIKERWQSTPKACSALKLRVPESVRDEVCKIGNRVAKAIGKRCLKGVDEDFTIDVSRQAGKNPGKAISAFVDLSFGNIWDVETHANCKTDFILSKVRGKPRILVDFD